MGLALKTSFGIYTELNINSLGNSKCTLVQLIFIITLQNLQFENENGKTCKDNYFYVIYMLCDMSNVKCFKHMAY